MSCMASNSQPLYRYGHSLRSSAVGRRSLPMMSVWKRVRDWYHSSALSLTDRMNFEPGKAMSKATNVKGRPNGTSWNTCAVRASAMIGSKLRDAQSRTRSSPAAWSPSLRPRSRKNPSSEVVPVLPRPMQNILASEMRLPQVARLSRSERKYTEFLPDNKHRIGRRRSTRRCRSQRRQLSRHAEQLVRHLRPLNGQKRLDSRGNRRVSFGRFGQQLVELLLHEHRVEDMPDVDAMFGLQPIDAVRPFDAERQRRILPVHAVLEQRLVDEPGSLQKIGIERIHDVVGTQLSRHPTELFGNGPLEADGRPEAAGIGTVARQRFKAIVGRLIRIAVGSMQRFRVFVDVIGIRGDERHTLLDPDIRHLRDHLRQHDVVAMANEDESAFSHAEGHADDEVRVHIPGIADKPNVGAGWMFGQRALYDLRCLIRRAVVENQDFQRRIRLREHAVDGFRDEL